MKKLLSMTEVAGILDVSIDRAYALAREGILPVVKMGRQIRADQDVLQNWISSGGKAYPGGWKREL